MEYTIEDLKNGKCAINYKSEKNLDGLTILLSSVCWGYGPHPDNYYNPTGNYNYYFIKPQGNWSCEDYIALPSKPVSYFLDQLNKVKEKTLPRVMWVSENSFTTEKKRVVFMIKNGRYLAWESSETIEDSEKTVNVTNWKYAKEVEELIFPFSLTPQNALVIINDIACSDWKTKLANKWGSDIVLGNNINIEEKEYSDAYNLCDNKQKESLDKIFK